MIELIAGIIGSILLLIAWFFETFESVKYHKSLIDLKFATLYMGSIIFLTIYSYLKNDNIFIFINVSLMILVAFEIIYTVYKTRR